MAGGRVAGGRVAGGRVAGAGELNEIVEHDDGIAAGAHANRRNARAAHGLECPNVALRVGRQIGEVAHARDVFGPAREHLVDGHGVVEVTLGNGHLLDANTILDPLAIPPGTVLTIPARASDEG